MRHSRRYDFQGHPRSGSRSRDDLSPLSGLFFLFCCSIYLIYLQGVPIKTDPLDYIDDNFSKYGLILTIFSLLQQENYGAQNLSYFSHLTFIMLPLYLVKQTLMLVSMSLLRHYCLCIICYILMLLIMYIG